MMARRTGIGADEAAHAREDDGCEERDGGDDGTFLRRRLYGAVGGSGLECHLRCCRREADADDDHDRGDEDRREQTVEPAGADKLDDACDEQEDAACNDDARKRCVEALACTDDHNRADEGEGAAEVAGNLVAGDEQVADRADAGAHDCEVRIQAGEHGNEHRGAEHAHHVLDAERDGTADGHAVVHADDLPFMVCHESPFEGREYGPYHYREQEDRMQAKCRAFYQGRTMKDMPLAEGERKFR
jgi:hypothetical protein